MRLLVSAAAAAAVLLVFASGAGAQSPTLFGTVGPGFQIKLADASGNPVTHLDPGTYTIQIEDKADIHNFHLTGPGVDKATDIEQTGTFLWTVTFTNGTYRYQCDPHFTTMRGTFTVGTPPPATTPPPVATTKLSGSVGPGKRIAVRRAGATVRVVTLKAGAALLVVRDLSAVDNFHLTGPGVNRTTTKAGKGTFTWKLALKAGLYRYRSDATATLKGSFRVTAS
jgi:plastocyanin